MIQGHTFLDHCWVCQRKFGPDLLEERHHIIPEAYGGTDGPQVSLCSDHHSGLHEVALRMYDERTFFDLLSTNKVQNQRLIYLATVAYTARIETEDDPNKRQMVVVNLDGRQKQMLKELKTVYPKTSQPKLLALALENLYARHFMKRR